MNHYRMGEKAIERLSGESTKLISLLLLIRSPLYSGVIYFCPVEIQIISAECYR